MDATGLKKVAADLHAWLDQDHQISALERAHLENLATSCAQAVKFFLARNGTGIATINTSTNTVVRYKSNHTYGTTEQSPGHKTRKPPTPSFSDLAQDADLELYGQRLIAEGWLTTSERDDVALWEYAEQAIRTARNPAGLMCWLIQTHRQRLDLPPSELKARKLSVWIDPKIQEAAAARRRAWKFGEQPGLRDDLEAACA